MANLVAGAARRPLDPPLGIAMAGYGARTGRALSVHDELCVQALVLSDGPHKLAIAGVDLLALGNRIADEVCEGVAAQSGIPPDAVIIGATHTHSGPFFNIFATPKREARVGDDRNLEWERELPGKIAATIVEADRALVPVRLRAASARVTLGTNRRLATPVGETRLFPNYNGVADPELKALGAYRNDGRPLAFVLNYPCHGVMLCEDNLLYSRDYMGFAQDEIERLAGDGASGAISIFLNGATGNIDPRIRGSFEAAQEAGATMGRAAFEALKHAPAIVNAEVMVRRVPLSVKLKDLEAASAAARNYLAQTELSLRDHRGGDYRLGRIRAEHERAQQMLGTIEALREMNRRDRRVNPDTGEAATRLSVARIGNLAIVGLPGEAFVEFGLALKANPYFAHTFVVGYCNDLIGYIPTREAYPDGGYEVDTARVAAGVGELMVATAMAQLRELHAGSP